MQHADLDSMAGPDMSDEEEILRRILHYSLELSCLYYIQ
jgi:hypothetical protein